MAAVDALIAAAQIPGSELFSIRFSLPRPTASPIAICFGRQKSTD